MVEKTAEKRAREEFVTRLTGDGHLDDPRVRSAVASLDRSAFAPDAALEAVYSDDAIRIIAHEDGRWLSTVSAGWLQAAMATALAVEPGDRIIEVGSGGYNAALLAQLAGPTGSVLSVDIDPSVIDRARVGIAAQDVDLSGIEVRVADAWRGLGEEEADRIMLTVDVAHVPWPLVSALRDGGTFLAPMRLGGLGTCVLTRRRGDALIGGIPLTGGFVGAQGEGEAGERPAVVNTDENSWLTGTAPGSVSTEAFDAMIAESSRVHETGVQIGPILWLNLFLWIGAAPFPTATWSATTPRPEGFTAGSPFGTPVAIDTDGGLSLAAPAARWIDDEHLDLIVHAYGPRGDELAERLAAHIRAWDAIGGDDAKPEILIRPHSADPTPDGWLPAARLDRDDTFLRWTPLNEPHPSSR
ncbi:class I SAM-dependent methyltransferase [Microbacterium gorillae]|uniref:hypothetical protein n=1 Tax=Microbacterium gorillae TaxID=1231063 RepID=UPI0006947E0D|nr:hypothetical protein [Microbacterium gorillae]